MPSEDPDVDGTAVQGPAVLSVEKQWRRIMLSVGNQQHNLENPSGPHLAPPTSPNKNCAKWLLRLRLPRFLLLGLSGYVSNANKTTHYSFGARTRTHCS
jgi:hypothetical protein